MANNQIQRSLEFANVQLAAEAFLLRANETSLPNTEEMIARLVEGNTHVSRFVSTQAETFVSRYEVLAQYRNDPKLSGGSGFSGTLFRNRTTGELTLSFRSTEFIDDAVRDNKSTNELEIKNLGWAFGQIAEMEDWYAQLRADPNLLGGKTFNVTGYSLGGHLATAFNILRREEAEAGGTSNPILATYTFNGAGVGGIKDGMRLTDVLSAFREVRSDPESALWTTLDEDTRVAINLAAQSRVMAIEAEWNRLNDPAFAAPFAFDTRPPEGEQATLQYQIAALVAGRQTIGASNFPLPGGTNWVPSDPVFAAPDQRFANMIEIVGSDGGNLGPSFISNSGVHYGARQEIYIEDQPKVRGTFPVLDILQANLLVSNPSQNDFGDTHSLVLLVDSLSLMAAVEAIDPNVTIPVVREIYAAMSNSKADTLIGTQGEAEGDSLERVLDAVRQIVVGPNVLPTLSNYDDALPGNTWHTSALREPFHQGLQQLGDAITAAPGPLTLVSLVSTSAAEMTTRAQAANGLAYRYALSTLTPFAILGPDSLYAPHNEDGHLELYDPAASARSGMSAEYLVDRSAFLAWKNLANAANVNRLPGLLGPDNWRFVDQGQGYKLNVVGQVLGGDSTAPFHLALFGTSRTDAINGGPEADRLYGIGGTDHIRGAAGNDYLEGGAGLDVYQYNASGISTNDGADTILDTDGRGLLRYSYRPAIGDERSMVMADASVNVSTTEWRSADGKLDYVLVPGAQGQSDLVVTFVGDAGGSLTLRDFRDGDFGIRLWSARGEPQTTLTITGDQDASLGTDALGNPIGNAVADRDDTLYGSRPDEAAPPDAPGDRIEAGGGNDVALADRPNNALDNGLGNADHVIAGAGRDQVAAGAGNDLVEAGLDGVWSGTIDGAPLTDPGGDIVDGGAGNDALYADARVQLSDAILWSSGTDAGTGTKGDFLQGNAGDDWVIGGAADDAVLGGGGGDVVIGGAGDDTLYGDDGKFPTALAWSVNRSVVVQDGRTQYVVEFQRVGSADASAGGADTLYGGAGADWAFGGGADDFIDGGAGNDVLFGEAGSDAVVGGAGNDLLAGDNSGVVAPADEGGDVLDGGAGDDVLQGDGGDDILIGGPGGDTLTGGAGKDLYVFGKGDGEDTIFDVAAGANDPEASVLVLGEGVARDSIKFRTGSLLVDLGDGDKVHVQGFDQVDPTSTTVLGAIQFADGTSMSYADVLAQGFDIDGSEEDDDAHDAAHPSLVGTGVNDRIHGLGGNDVLFGLAGDDVLDGDAGNDQLQGDVGADVLRGGTGTDLLFGEGGGDTLSGGAGNDTLVGGTGDDAYPFAHGDGQDLVFDQDATAGNGDWVEFAADIGPDDVDATREAANPGNLVLTIRGASDSLAIANQFAGSDYRVEEIRFADGTIWTPATTPLLLRGSAGADFLAGTSGTEVLEGLAGNDTLSGGAGNDTYRYGRGDGRDTITDYDPTAGNADTILLAADIAPSEVSTGRAGNDLVLTLEGTTDGVTVSNYFSNDGDTPYSVEHVRFASDGTTWDVETVKQRVVAPTAGNDSITGYAGGDDLAGLGGNDTILGAGGNDSLSGDAGDDFLVGGAGSDVFAYAAGDGADIVSDTGGATDADMLRFAAGIAPGDVALKRSRVGSLDDLLVDVSAGNARIRVVGQFAGDEVGQQGVERIEFYDGTAWDRAAIRLQLLTATSGPDELYGFASGDVIDGLGGDDTVEGAAGNDTLHGESGSDFMVGGLGDDTFLFNLGDGQDVVSDKYGIAGFPGGGIDTLRFGAGIAPANVTASRTLSNALQLQVNGTADFAQLSQYFADDAVERIEFTDGTVWTPATVAAMFPVNGTSGNDTLTGSGLPDTINALQGDDSVRGGGGDDTIDGGPGYDKLYGEAGDDVINGGAADTGRRASSDTLYGGAGNDVLIVGSANGQYLYGEAGNDIYLGGSGWAWMEDTGGSNVLMGSSAGDNINLGDGNDLAIGGRGSDSINADADYSGVLGRDLLVYNKGDGQDSAWRFDSQSTLSIGGGALYSNLSLEVSATALVLNVGTGSIAFQRWYDTASPGATRVKYLQIVIDGTKLYAQGSADPMRNRKIQYFDFEGLVAGFDAARAAGQKFSVADSLAQYRLWGSDTEAFGGAIAYRYAMSGSLGALTHEQMRAVTGDPAFGNAPQPIAVPASAASTTENAVVQDMGASSDPIVMSAGGGVIEASAAAASEFSTNSSAAGANRARPAGLPEAWFGQQPLPQSPATSAAAWRRIARDLPVHLDDSAGWGGVPPFASWASTNRADAIGVRVTFDRSVGIADSGASRLRPFEGLKDGLSLIA